MRDPKVLEWALTHTVERVQIGYTGRAEGSEEPNDWVALIDLGNGGERTDSIKISLAQAELFDFGPANIDFTRSIARLKDSVKAEVEVRERTDALERSELAELKRLKAKYEPTVGRRPRERR